MKIFPLHSKDFYKVGHIDQYPKGTTKVYSNFTPRSGKHSNVPSDKIVFVGLQLFIKDYLINDWNEMFFSQPKNEVCKKYHRRMKYSLGKDISVAHFEALHDLGYLPLKIKALPEGSVVKYGIPVMTIVNTLDEFYWLTNALETTLSADMWKIMTSATTYNEYRKLFKEYALKTVGNTDFVPFQGHDFSFRGMSSRYDAAISGLGHLMGGSVGTDTIPAIDLAEEYYNANVEEELVGCSVAATEHSVMCAGGKDSEIDTFMRLISQIYPDGIISIVSDTWDFWKVVTEYLVELKLVIMGRDGKVVIRPDSGDPVRIIAGYAEDEIIREVDGIFTNEENPRELMECEVKGLIQCLWDIFGGSYSDTGYKMVDDHIGAIYGDSITYERANEILKRLEQKGFASTNIVFGIGSYTYQMVTRDTHGFAMKATYVENNGEGFEIFKDPKTDDGTKKSAKGLLLVAQVGKEFELYDQVTPLVETKGALETVFKDGVLCRDESLSEIRERIRFFD